MRTPVTGLLGLELTCPIACQLIRSDFTHHRRRRIGILVGQFADGFRLVRAGGGHAQILPWGDPLHREYGRRMPLPHVCCRKPWGFLPVLPSHRRRTDFAACLRQPRAWRWLPEPCPDLRRQRLAHWAGWVAHHSGNILVRSRRGRSEAEDDCRDDDNARPDQGPLAEHAPPGNPAPGDSQPTGRVAPGRFRHSADVRRTVCARIFGQQHPPFGDLQHPRGEVFIQLLLRQSLQSAAQARNSSRSWRASGLAARICSRGLARRRSIRRRDTR